MENKQLLPRLRRKLKFRIRLGELLSSLSIWISGSIFAWGTLILLLRLFSPDRMSLAPYGGGLVIGALLFGLLFSSWKKYQEEDLTALLDERINGKNLLVSIEETGSRNSTWEQFVLRKAEKGNLHLPAINWKPVLKTVGPALLFLGLTWFTPLPEFRNSIDTPGNALVKEKVKELRKKITMVEKENLMKKKEARQLKKKLNELKKADFSQFKKKDNPWSVLDSVNKKLNRSLQESSRAVTRTQMAASNFSRSMESDKNSTSDNGNQKKGTKQKNGSGQQSNNGAGKLENALQQKELSAALRNLKKTGLKNDPRLKKLLKKLNSKNLSGKKFNGKKIKNWKNLKKLAKKLGKRLRKKHARMHKKGM